MHAACPIKRRTGEHDGYSRIVDPRDHLDSAMLPCPPNDFWKRGITSRRPGSSILLGRPLARHGSRSHGRGALATAGMLELPSSTAACGWYRRMRGRNGSGPSERAIHKPAEIRPAP